MHGARVLDDALLLVSELVTNAVLHGEPPLTVRTECRGEAGMVVVVGDGAEHVPQRKDASATAESGRGIALVDVVSDAWEVEPLEHGKQVWFRLRGPGLAATA